jgi:hypothetical protein
MLVARDAAEHPVLDTPRLGGLKLALGGKDRALVNPRRLVADRCALGCV